jgi:hypothetical protein
MTALSLIDWKIERRGHLHQVMPAHGDVPLRAPGEGGSSSALRWLRRFSSKSGDQLPSLRSFSKHHDAEQLIDDVAVALVILAGHR